MLARKHDRQFARAPAPASAPSQFVASVIDDGTRDTVRVIAGQLGYQNPGFLDGGAEAVLTLVTTSQAPQFLIVDISDSSDPLATMQSIVERCRGGTKLVAIGMVNDVGLYRRLIDMGVSDYLVKPVYGPTLSEAIQSATRGGGREPARAKAARLVALIGARGGVGTTTMAVSAAWTMSQDKQQRIVLLDLDLHFGSLALSLDLEPGRGLREILTNPDRIDSLLIRSSMSNANEQLRVLAAEEPLEDSLDIGHVGLEALITDLGDNTDCIVIDVPRSLDAMGRHTLARADIVAIVTEQSLPAMRDTQRLLSLLKAIRNDGKIVVVANRVGGVSGEIGRADFERGIGGKVDFAIPFDKKTAVAAAERARAFVDIARDAKTASALRELAVALAGTGRSPKGSFLKWIRGK